MAELAAYMGVGLLIAAFDMRLTKPAGAWSTRDAAFLVTFWPLPLIAVALILAALLVIDAATWLMGGHIAGA